MCEKNEAILSLSPCDLKKLVCNLKKSLQAYEINSLDHLDNTTITAIIVTLLAEAYELNNA